MQNSITKRCGETLNGVFLQPRYAVQRTFRSIRPEIRMRTEALRSLLIALLLVNPSYSFSALAQSSSNRVAGAYVAQGLLMRLANPKSTNFRVGLVNTAAEFGVLVSPKDASPGAEYFRGFSREKQSTWNLSWAATEQLDASVDNLTFEVIRKKIASPQECSELELTVSRFYKELEAVLKKPLLLSEIPQEHQLESITVDGTSYIIQIWTGEETLAIYPDRDIDMALDNASSALMRVISGCSNELPGVIEEHYSL